MRTLFILRGLPASGKSTWIAENNLEPYTISTDTLRLMYQSPVTKKEGGFEISQGHDKEVWKLLYELLERRMENGEFVIIDATHYKAPLINKYKEFISRYRYRMFVVDFTNVSKEELFKRNSQRGFRAVPNEVIEKMYEALTSDNEVKKQHKVITPEEALKMIESPIEPYIMPENYKKVVIFGDIHGCYAPLKEYFDKNPFDKDINYIFTGDYIDRGIENKEVLEFLLSIREKSNCIFLEGNHERWLRIYSQKDYNIDDYIRTFEYKDPYVTKVVHQLKDKIIQIEKKIEYNKRKGDAISVLLKESWKENPNNTKVYYEFELLDVPETHKQLKDETIKLESQLEKLNRLVAVIQHEEHNTKSLLKDCKKWYDENFEELSMDISSVLENKFLARSLKKDNPIKSAEFIKNTYPQIQMIDKKEIRRFCDKLAQMSYFTFKNKNYLVTHGGVPTLPSIKTQTKELIHGVGDYNDHNNVDMQFCYNTECKVIQIHGHRNSLNDPIEVYPNGAYNLEGQVEYGGSLRILEITDSIKTIEIKNNVYKQVEVVQSTEKSDIEILRDMYKSPLINVREQEDNIVSFNFNKDAFYNSKWNDLTCTARGLFIDKSNGNVVARSYNKFFNFEECESTKLPSLKKSLAFPLKGYLKENGYLGLISMYKNKVHFFTKSMMDKGDYAYWFIGVLCDHYNIKWVGNVSYSDIYNQSLIETSILEKSSQLDALEKMTQDLKNKLSSLLTEGYTYVFECVDKDNDPHIIKYKENKPILLEVFKNQLQEITLSYDKLIEISKDLNVPLKKQELYFETWEEFETWVNNFTTSLEFKQEGYVFEDANHFRVKFKSPYYRFWKEMRKVKEIIEKGGANKKIYKTKAEIQVCKLLEELKNSLHEMSIIDVEDVYHDRYGFDSF